MVVGDVIMWIASFIHVLRCDLVKELDLSGKNIGDTDAEMLAEILPNLINLTENRPDSRFLRVLSSAVSLSAACTP